MARSICRQAEAFVRGMSNRQTAVLVLMAFLLLSILMTWPLIVQLGEALPWNNRGDHWMHQWTFWWVKNALAEGQNPYYTHLLYHPDGVSLVTHNIAWLNIIPWIPLQALVGGYAATNLSYIGLFALNGFAMYLLVRELTSSLPAAFIGGLIFAFWPYMTSQTGHPNSIIAFWLPLALLFLTRLLQRGRFRDAIWTGLFIALGGIGRWQFLIIGGLLVGLYLVFKCLTETRCRTKRTLALLLLAALVAALLMAPFAAPIVAALPDLAQSEQVVRGTGRSADLLAYVVPNQTLAISNLMPGGLPERLTFDHDQMEYMGLVVLLLAIYGSAKRWKSARFWILAGLLLLALALGPELRFGNSRYPRIPMPYRLVEDWILVRIQAFPHRFNAYLALPVAMLAALGVTNLTNRRARGWKTTALVSAIACLILAEYALVPYPTEEPRTPDWYTRLAEDPGSFAIVDLPLSRTLADKWYMLYQITHGKALVEGHVSRMPVGANEFLDGSPFLAGLRKDGIMNPELIDVTRQLRPLVEADIRYLVLHKQFSGPEQREAWGEWLVFDPLHEDDDLVVYRTDPSPGRDYELTHTFGDHLGLIRTGFGPEKVTQGDFLWIDTNWASDGRPEGDYRACASLAGNTGRAVEAECQPPLAELPTSSWAGNELVRGRTVLQLDPFSPPGVYTITLSLEDEQSGALIGQPLPLGSVEIEALPRAYELPDVTHQLDARWADLITLPGYDLQKSEAHLSLTLYWQALRRMPSSYKIFAHVVDLSTGTVVAQVDTVPRDWTYPTNWWDSGEVVEDTLTIAVDGLPPGPYRLQVGIYEPDSGERLPAFSADGKPFPESAVPISVFQR